MTELYIQDLPWHVNHSNIVLKFIQIQHPTYLGPTPAVAGACESGGAITWLKLSYEAVAPLPLQLRPPSSGAYMSKRALGLQPA